MIQNVEGLRIYTVVEVWRGIAAGAKSFVDLGRAQEYMRRAQARRNLQDDDVQLFEDTVRVIPPARRATRHARAAERT